MTKKLFSSALSAALCAALLAAPISAYAAQSYSVDSILKNYVLGEEDTYAVETSNFSYQTGRYGITLQSDAAELQDVQFMVTGVYTRSSGTPFYYLTPVNNKFNGRGGYDALDGAIYQVGDFLRFDNVAYTEPVYNPDYIDQTYDPESGDPAAVTNLGNALDIFGEDFMPVLRHELLIFGGKTVPLVQQKPQNITLIPGDITEDGKLNIMDVITLNKTLLGGRTSNSYQRLVSDADGDGEVTQADALLMMKYIVGLVESIGA